MSRADDSLVKFVAGVALVARVTQLVSSPKTPAYLEAVAHLFEWPRHPALDYLQDYLNR